jgi:hypothetical protein
MCELYEQYELGQQELIELQMSNLMHASLSKKRANNMSEVQQRLAELKLHEKNESENQNLNLNINNKKSPKSKDLVEANNEDSEFFTPLTLMQAKS